MDRFYSFRLSKEVENDRLSDVGIEPTMIEIILLFCFKEADIDLFDICYAAEYKNSKHVMMFNLGEFQEYIYEKYHSIFDCVYDSEFEFYEDFMLEVKSWITTDGVDVNWVPGQQGDQYLVISQKND